MSSSCHLKYGINTILTSFFSKKPASPQIAERASSSRQKSNRSLPVRDSLIPRFQLPLKVYDHRRPGDVLNYFLHRLDGIGGWNPGGLNDLELDLGWTRPHFL